MGRDGKIWYANDNVVQMIDTTHFDEEFPPPLVHIEQIVAGKEVYSPHMQLDLPSHTRDVEIDYTGLSFAAPQKIHFLYKLDGLDQTWQDAGTRRQALYTNLSPKAYRFQVLASNSDGAWSRVGATVAFTLAPAFYQTTWFILICIAGALLIIWIAHRTRTQYVSSQMRAGLEERMQERESVARDLHDTLLQSVQGLSLSLHAVAKRVPDTEPAHQMIKNTLVRTDDVLLEARDRVKSLRLASEDTSDLVESLTESFQRLVHDGAIDFIVKVEGEKRELHPVVRDEAYWIGREALVNAFQHGSALGIEVTVLYGSKTLQLRFSDNGQGIDPKILNAGGKPRHWGLAGMRERAHKIGGSLEIKSQLGVGTEIRLIIPASIAYRAGLGISRWSWTGAIRKVHQHQQRDRQVEGMDDGN